MVALKCEFEGTSSIMPETTYLIESDPIFIVLSIGFTFPKIFLAVVSDKTTLWGLLSRFFGSPFTTRIVKKLKKDESASIISLSVKICCSYSTVVGPMPFILRKSSTSGNSFGNVGPIIAGVKAPVIS